MKGELGWVRIKVKGNGRQIPAKIVLGGGLEMYVISLV